MNTTIILQGSSNSNGNTNKVVNYLNYKNEFDIIDLKTKNIGHFDYDFKNFGDDFFPLMKEIIENYNTIVFATPVYWYSMSGILKVFFDRISDLLYNQKELGRQLRGKKMAMISNSGANDRIETFNMPFVESAGYLGMTYLGDIHTWMEANEIHPEAKALIDDFRVLIQ